MVVLITLNAIEAKVADGSAKTRGICLEGLAGTGTVSLGRDTAGTVAHTRGVAGFDGSPAPLPNLASTIVHSHSLTVTRRC